MIHQLLETLHTLNPELTFPYLVAWKPNDIKYQEIENGAGHRESQNTYSCQYGALCGYAQLTNSLIQLKIVFVDT